MPNADNTDTSVSETTVTEEAVDTSTNEEAPETEADNTDLEDMDISFDDVDDDETEESDDSESEVEDTEPAESEEESAEDAEESKETEDSEDNSDKESDERKPSDEDVKRHNQEMAAKRIAEKQSREAAKRTQQAEYLEGAIDDTQLAVRQLQVDAYNNLVEKNVNRLENDMQKAVSSIELFQKGSPEVKEELLRRADDFEQKYVRYDKNGDPIGVNGSLYEYLQNEADSIQRILDTGARNQSKAKDRAKSRTETLPSRAPKEPKVDPDLAAFDEEVAKWA